MTSKPQLAQPILTAIISLAFIINHTYRSWRARVYEECDMRKEKFRSSETNRIKSRILKLTLLLIMLGPTASMAQNVTVGDFEWMQPNETINSSWDDIAAVCNPAGGPCAGTLGTVNMNGWHWAASYEVAAVFTEFIPYYLPQDPLTETNSSWAPYFLNIFIPTFSDDTKELVWGLTRDLVPNGAASAWVLDGFDSSSVDSATIKVTVATDERSVATGGWFSRFIISNFIVGIDIKPGSEPNCFNVNGHGVIPVAILGSDVFDVTNIDNSTLLFGELEVRIRGKKGPLCSLQYSNSDTYLDLVCHFEDDADNWDPGDGEAILTGKLYDQTEFEGTDSICIVPG